MAKDQERKIAKVMYAEQGKTAKEIAERFNLSENTVGNWVNANDGEWKKLRNAYETMPDQLITSLKELLNALVERRLELQRDVDADPKEKVNISDEISKVSKSLEAAQKDSRISLSTYLKVMESVFNALQQKHPKIYIQLLDFQEEHINAIAKLHD